MEATAAVAASVAGLQMPSGRAALLKKAFRKYTYIGLGSGFLYVLPSVDRIS